MMNSNSNSHFSFTIGNMENSVAQQGRFISNTINISLEQEHKQNFAETTAEIQDLLDHLAQTHFDRTEATLVSAIQTEINHNSTLKVRLISALKAGGVEALKSIFNHPLVSVPIETIKGFLEAEAQ